MREKIIFELPSVSRENMLIRGYAFGSGRKSLCIVGSTRGNEIMQTYVCALLVRKLKELESSGRLAENTQILVIPSVNTASMNVQKRFWPCDNTDINRMFPGYDKGETTQRIAATVFDKIKDYDFGIQMASFYQSGLFQTHVKMMDVAGFGTDHIRDFGLRCAVVRRPRPYDTTTLNYNWRLWDTCAFSLYTDCTDTIDEKAAEEAAEAVLRFMKINGMARLDCGTSWNTRIVNEEELYPVRAGRGGFMSLHTEPGKRVKAGETLGQIIDPMDASVKEIVTSPCDGEVFFASDRPLVLQDNVLFKIIAAADHN